MPQCNKVSDFDGVGEALPTLKRKRKSEGYLEPVVDPETDTKTCFTNAAFSSTPKKLAARRRTALTINNNFIQNPCLEVKSIADIVNLPNNNEVTKVSTSTQTQNPYEVVRKPPKKKKRETEIIEACFENPALNLELPEKQFNPYEVLRELSSKETKPTQTNCFINEALNLRTQDAAATRNPYEIQRCTTTASNAVNVGVENPALDAAVAAEPTSLRIALPFKPTLGCRIDFSNLPVEELTPSKLLAEKLVFSPVLAVPKRSLDLVSEDSSMDIGRELDRYQLELENSINEAKMRKTLGTDLETKATELTAQLDVEQRITFTQRLAEIVEEDEEKENECCREEIRKEGIINTHPFTTTEQHIELSGKTESDIRESEHEDVVYASDSDEDELDFKAPAPFVRAYQRAAAPQAVGSKESLHSTGSADSPTNHKKSLNVRNIIRKSIRKLMHPNKHEELAKTTENDASDNEQLQQNEDGKEKERQHNIAYKLIRNSLRRKASNKTTTIPSAAEQAPAAKAEISIIDTSERTMKLKAELLPKMERNERKHTLRSSLRRSTREMGQHLMKTMFHKNQEAYELRE